MEDDPLEQRLDQALEATFPASDPIAVSPTVSVHRGAGDVLSKTINNDENGVSTGTPKR
jgi:hypothetical protein